MKLIFTFLLSCTVSVFGGRRISHGDEIDINLAPYYVGLIYNRTFFCGGSLLSKTFVLTAAHCTHFFDPHEITISVGSKYYEKEKGATHIGALNFYIHPLYSVIAWLDYDFSLIEIEDVQDFPKQASFIELPQPEDELKEGDFMFIAGIGFTENGATTSLRATSIPIFNHNDCKDYYLTETSTLVTDRMICAGYEFNATNACAGDSGGALRRESDGKIFGITSWGQTPCGVFNTIGVYANVQSALDWIIEIAFAQ